MLRCLLPAPLLLLAACPTSVPVDTCEPEEEIPYDGVDQDCDGVDPTDVDGDGFDSWRVDGDDCDDEDAGVHPGVAETCDGVDQDCDEDIDEDALDALTWYADEDSDGWGNEQEVFVACEAEWWWSDHAGDCDDQDNQVAPGLDERCDGKDDDCNGLVDDDPVDGAWLYPDLDGDGWGDAEGEVFTCPGEGWIARGRDCDDVREDVNPDQEEICDDGADQDCDGTPMGCGPWGSLDASSIATATVAAESTTGSIGELPQVIDADGDGLGDLLLGDRLASERGVVYLLHGPFSSSSYQAPVDASLSVDGEGVIELGEVQAAADLDGDGADELLLGSSSYHSGSGAVWVVDASLTGTLGLEDLSVALSGSNGAELAGSDVAGVGDLDGDGYEDLLIGAPGADIDELNQGAAYLVLGPVESSASLADADATLLLADNRAELGAAVGVADDLDGDGASDLLLGAPGLEAVLVVSTPLTGLVDLSSAPQVLGADGTLGERGTFAAGHVDGDGVSELLVGQPREGEGVAYLFSGPIGAAGWILADADSVLEGSTAQRLGAQVLLPGDVDGDGFGDLALWASRTAEVVLFRGPPAATDLAVNADGLLWVEDGADDPLGAGDLDGDGRVDLLVGRSGEVLLVEGHCM